MGQTPSTPAPYTAGSSADVPAPAASAGRHRPVWPLAPSGCSGLSAECAAVEDEHRESFRTCIDGGSETGGPGTHDDDVVEAVRIDRSQQADAAGELGFGRIAQELSAWTKHVRQLTGIDMEALNQCLGIRIDLSIDLW